MPERIPQSVTIRVPFQAYLSSDHVTDATGKTIAITISKNGAAYGNPSAGATNAVEVASGSYYVDLSATDTGTLGPLWILGSVATVDKVHLIYNVVDPKVTLAATGLDNVLIATKTLPNAIKYIGAVLAGTIPSGAGSGTEAFNDFSGALAVTFTTDAAGDRLTATYV